ncbi:PLDc N-terminal domain-containing protein [Leucobacter sp. UCMA 4100]|nr:PLDc N-terminal domain-containing protein [Leucobacter sp. UCMA 4100]
MDANVNPLMSAGYDVVWIAFVACTVVMIAIALVSIRRNRQSLTSWQALIWGLVVIFVPIIGPAAWLLAGRPARLPAATE